MFVGRSRPPVLGPPSRPCRASLRVGVCPRNQGCPSPSPIGSCFSFYSPALWRLAPRLEVLLRAQLPSQILFHGCRSPMSPPGEDLTCLSNSRLYGVGLKQNPPRPFSLTSAFSGSSVPHIRKNVMEPNSLSLSGKKSQHHWSPFFQFPQSHLVTKPWSLCFINTS